MRNENPFVDSDMLERVKHTMPASASMRQTEVLTQLQQAHLPALMWLFDTDRYRAQGRSTLLAYVAIKLAMQGETVYLDDVSLTLPHSHRTQSYFAQLVLRLCDTHFPKHRFIFNPAKFTLQYQGQHP